MKQLNATFAALADPTRRAALERLLVGDARVSELAAPFAMSLPAVLLPLKVLEATALIERDKCDGRTLIRLHANAMASARDWLDVFVHSSRRVHDVRARRGERAAFCHSSPCKPLILRHSAMTITADEIIAGMKKARAWAFE